MVQKDPLFTLIKSLSKNEKGYFKKHSRLYSGHQQDKTYLRLFDTLAAAKEFDKKKLRRKMGNGSMFNNFTVAKQFLYDRILHSLEAFHHSTNFELKNYCRRIEILYHKGLTEQSQRLIKKAKEKALLYDRNIALLEILWLENEVSRMRRYINTDRSFFALFYKTLQKLECYFQYRELASDIMVYVNEHGALRSKKAMDAFVNRFRKRLFKKELPPEFWPRLVWYWCLDLYYEALEDEKGVLKTMHQLDEYLSRHQHHIQDIPIAFQFPILQLIRIYSLRRDKEQMLHYLSRLQQHRQMARTSYLRERLLMLVQSYYSEIQVRRMAGDFEEALPAIKQFCKIDESESNRPIYQIILILIYYNIALVYLGTAKYRKAIEFLNRIIHLPEQVHYQEYQYFSRIVLIMVHYQLGKFDLLEKLIPLTRQELQRTNRMLETERLILNFYELLVQDVPTKPVFEKELDSLLRKLRVLRGKPIEERLFGMFPLMEWFRAMKAGEKSFAELCREGFGCAL